MGIVLAKWTFQKLRKREGTVNLKHGGVGVGEREAKEWMVLSLNIFLYKTMISYF